MQSIPKWENKLGEKEGDKGFDVEFWWGWEVGVVGVDAEGMEQNRRRQSLDSSQWHSDVIKTWDDREEGSRSLEKDIFAILHEVRTPASQGFQRGELWGPGEPALMRWHLFPCDFPSDLFSPHIAAPRENSIMSDSVESSSERVRLLKT